MRGPRRWWKASAAALLLVCGAAVASASRDGQPNAPETDRAFARLQSDSSGSWRMEWDRAYGQIRSLWGRTPPRPGDPETLAATFLRDRHALFGLPADLRDLTVSSRRESPAGTHLIYEQTWRGLVVFKGGIDVHVSHAGEVFLVHNRYVTPDALAGKSAMPMLSEADVLDVARAALTAAEPGAASTPNVSGSPVLLLYRGRSAVELAYRVLLGGRRYVVSAETGAVLESAPIAQRVNGRGRVFVFDPNLVADVKTLWDIRAAGNPVRYLLEGPHVRLFEATRSFLNGSPCYSEHRAAWGNHVLRVPPRPSDAAFIYARSHTGFAHTNVYFHIDRSQRYVQGLGFTHLLNNGILADGHAFANNNSFFCPSVLGQPAYIAFGDGGVNDAEDPDLIVHEYGHALQDAGSAGRYVENGETGSMAEGFADYWAFSAKPAALGDERACIGKRNGRGRCLRRVDTNKTMGDYDEAGDDQAMYENSEIWSQALLDIFKLVANRRTADRLVLQSHFMVPMNPEFVDGAQALLLADELAGGTFKRRICRAMIDREIVDPRNNIVANACPVLIEGRVEGPGGAIANAVVRTSLDARTATTDAAGRFLLLTNTAVTPDRCCTPYTITISAAGFRTLSSQHVWGAFPTNQFFQLFP